MMTITDEQLAEWKRLADAAAPGPWSLELDRNDQQNVYSANRDWIALLPHQCVRSIEEERERDAAFIAAARTAVPALIAEVERLRVRVAELEPKPQPKCSCTLEAGDSACERHPTCSECGMVLGDWDASRGAIIARADAPCCECAPKPRASWSAETCTHASQTRTADGRRTCVYCGVEVAP